MQVCSYSPLDFDFSFVLLVSLLTSPKNERCHTTVTPFTPQWRPLASPRLTFDPGPDSLINCRMFMIYEYLLCMINGATGGTATQQKGKYCKREARQCKGLCRGKAFCLKMAPTLVEPYIILTFLNVAGLWLSVALRLERILLKVLRRLMHTKESHALIFVNPRHKVFVEFKRKHRNSRPRYADRDPWEVTHAKMCPRLRIPHLLPPVSVKESSPFADKG